MRTLLLPTSGSSAINVNTGVPGSADSLMGIFSASSRNEGGLSFASAMLISTSTLVDFGSPEKTAKRFCQHRVHTCIVVISTKQFARSKEA